MTDEDLEKLVLGWVRAGMSEREIHTLLASLKKQEK